MELLVNAFHGDGYGDDKYMGDGQEFLTLRCDCSGEDDCRCAGSNGEDSCRVMTEE